MTGSRKQLLLVAGMVVLVILAGIFFRDPTTPTTTASPTATASTATVASTTAAATTVRAKPTTVTAKPTARASSTASVPSSSSGLETVLVADLPPEAQEVYRQLLASGPFEYSKDGTVFGNREGLLPRQQNGYYREFTVQTPGSDDRGARRFVVGGCGVQTSTRPIRVTPCSSKNPIYYTDDHYDSFRRVQ